MSIRRRLLRRRSEAESNPGRRHLEGDELMRFVVIVKSDAKTEAGILPNQAELEAIGRYNAQLSGAGVLVAGEGFHASSLGTRVRVNGATTTIFDGPFPEANELVAGYWVIRVASQAEAVEWAKRIPFRDGAVEIRRVFELDDFPVDASETADGWRANETELRDAPPPARKAGTKRYVSLLKADRHTESGELPNEQLASDMGALIEEMAQNGALLGGEGLFPSAQGVRIRFDGDTRTVVDGPFAETKELIAGFTLYQTATKAEAVEYARRCLAIHMNGVGIGTGEIEVRQVLELEDFPVDPAEKPVGSPKQTEEARARLG
jgi:hypothetical protein